MSPNILCPETNEDLLFTDFWVDPISLIPTPKRPETWEMTADILERIEFTLGAICRAKAAKCGHCVDGTRHTSTYIDLKTLLADSNIEIYAYLKRSVFAALAQHGWDDFSPTHIVYPAGISRLERLGTSFPSINQEGDSSTMVYGTAIKSYVSHLKSIWSGSEEVEVLRAFDPGGNSRCANAIDAISAKEKALGDVVVLDDGMWTGRTIVSLLRAALAAGAKRVLVVPLLARLRPAEVAHWESVSSMTDSERRNVPICFFFPLIFPVPAYGSQECPYEVTQRRLQERSSLNASLNELCKTLLSELEGKTPSEVPAQDLLYTQTWVNARCYIELASENEALLEKFIVVPERFLSG